MCSAPVSTITELGPITGRTGELPAADGATSGGAVNTVLTASGELTITSFIPLGQNVSVNVSPSRRAQRSITHVGAIAHASVCTSAGARGPGGSAPFAGARRAAALSLSGVPADVVEAGAGGAAAIPYKLRQSARMWARRVRTREMGLGRAVVGRTRTAYNHGYRTPKLGCARGVYVAFRLSAARWCA